MANSTRFKQSQTFFGRFIGLCCMTVLAGCASSSDVDQLKDQVKDLQTRLAYLQQSVNEANHVAVQAAQTANDTRELVLGNSVKKEAESAGASAPKQGKVPNKTKAPQKHG